MESALGCATVFPVTEMETADGFDVRSMEGALGCATRGSIYYYIIFIIYGIYLPYEYGPLMD